jgi:predicted phosphoribosyltransferase
MIFANRSEAGRSLAWRLEKFANRDDVLILGIPRGGVPVAYEIARALHIPLDVLVLRKLGVPGHEELAFGAIALGGTRVLDRHILRNIGISAAEVEAVTARERDELLRREEKFRGDSPPLSLAGKAVILVDDGIATGASLLAGIRAVRTMAPAKLIVAVPVAPAETCERLADEVDEIVCVATPEPFGAVGQFYDDFSEVHDEDVIRLLAEHNKARAAAG